MRGVILAAGRGRRMGGLTATRPKCLLSIAGRPLLEHTVENLRAVGCDEIFVVVGYGAESICVSGVTHVLNPDYGSINVLHSLMSARMHLRGPVMVAYSDIWVEPTIYQRLSRTSGDLVLAVDRDWQAYYEGRTAHPVSEAETVYYDGAGRVQRIGKRLPFNLDQDLECGEFLGLWRMSASGTARLCVVFDELNQRLGPNDRFQAASNWRNAYFTDMTQELVDRGAPVSCCVIERGWAELDTPQDYERLQDLAERQRLWTMIRAPLQVTATRTVTQDAKQAYLKALGARVLSEANDLKRTPEALAKELGLDCAVIDAVIAGRADEQTAQQLMQAMAARYPIELGELIVAPDDTEEGVRTLAATDSRASARIIRRPDRTGSSQPYYEYRDTAMSRHAPFRPEWIKQLRHVRNSDAANPDVAYNRGHLLHQFTFFLGPVNFYWEADGKRHCAELDSGDSSYITPLVPHSFATRDPSREAFIVAVAYRTYPSRAVADLSHLGGDAIVELAGDLRDPESVFSARLRRHLDAESLSFAQLEARLVERGWDPLRATTVVRNGTCSDEELRSIAAALNVRVSDLAVHRLLSHEEVVVHQRRAASSHGYPNDTQPAYRLTELARTKHQPYLKAFDLEVIDSEGGELRHSLHEYAYNYGGTPVRLKWGTKREVVIEPGGSAYVRPFVAHTFARETRSSANVLIVRIPGLLDDDVTTELAGLDPNGRVRAAGESTVWF